MPLIPVYGRQRQAEFKFEASLVYIVPGHPGLNRETLSQQRDCIGSLHLSPSCGTKKTPRGESGLSLLAMGTKFISTIVSKDCVALELVPIHSSNKEDSPSGKSLFFR